MIISKDILFDRLSNNISDGIYVIDKDLRIVFLNNKVKEMLNLDKDDNSMLGKFCHEFSEGRLCSHTASICETVRTDHKYYNYELSLKKDTKKMAQYTHSTHKLFDENKKFIGVMAVIKDKSETHVLREHLNIADNFYGIVGKNSKMLDMYDAIKQVAHTNATVLVLGKSGTGKELVIDALHKLSQKESGPLIKVNCSALSENILESELFGHVKGSFTGAIRDKVGKFELAHKGTIFLDEIGELSKDVQVKLLRVLQEKEIEKVGDTKTKYIDVRIIAATNKNLREEVKNGNFREDLYYRLNVYPIFVPDLNQRLDDIDILCHHFLQKSNIHNNKNLSISLDVLDVFKHYSWPGNVRELEHAIEYAAIRSKNVSIGMEDLPNDIQQSIEAGETLVTSKDITDNKDQNINQESVLQVLNKTRWNKSKTAKELGIGRTTLWRLMKKFYIEDLSA